MNLDGTLSRLPVKPLEAPAHQQRAGESQPRDKAQVVRRTSAPLHGLAGVTRERGHVRAERNMAGAQVLLGGEDERTLRRRAHSGNRRSCLVGAA